MTKHTGGTVDDRTDSTSSAETSHASSTDLGTRASQLDTLRPAFQVSRCRPRWVKRGPQEQSSLTDRAKRDLHCRPDRRQRRHEYTSGYVPGNRGLLPMRNHCQRVRHKRGDGSRCTTDTTACARGMTHPMPQTHLDTNYRAAGEFLRSTVEHQQTDERWRFSPICLLLMATIDCEGKCDDAIRVVLCLIASRTPQCC